MFFLKGLSFLFQDLIVQVRLPYFVHHGYSTSTRSVASLAIRMYNIHRCADLMEGLSKISSQCIGNCLYYSSVHVQSKNIVRPAKHGRSGAKIKEVKEIKQGKKHKRQADFLTCL